MRRRKKRTRVGAASARVVSDDRGRVASTEHWVRHRDGSRQDTITFRRGGMFMVRFSSKASATAAAEAAVVATERVKERRRLQRRRGVGSDLLLSAGGPTYEGPSYE